VTVKLELTLLFGIGLVVRRSWTVSLLTVRDHIVISRILIVMLVANISTVSIVFSHLR